jgi:hypothetical protein
MPSAARRESVFTEPLDYHDFGYNFAPIVTSESAPRPTTRSSSRLRSMGVILLAAWVLFTTPAAWHIDVISRLGLEGFAGAAVLAALFPRVARGFERVLVAIPRWLFLTITVAIAAGASAWVALKILRGLPVSIDSSVYLLQARAISHGHFGMPFPGPRLAFGARFLFEGSDNHLHGVFPPGYPLFLAPFTRLDQPILAGPFTAALLVIAHYALGMRVTRDEHATRLAILLALPSYPRAIETADLLSHAFVAVLGSTALAVAFTLRDATSRNRDATKPPSRDRSALLAIALGAALGWAFAARLFDGILFASGAFVVLATAPWFRRQPRRSAALFALVVAGALPFVALVAAHQHAATGSWTTPTQYEYFARSDSPHGCHRLGFGRDVGCHVEHPEESDVFRAHGGYTPADGLHVTRERASLFSVEVVGAVIIAWLVFARLVWQPTRRDLFLAAFVVFFTAAYALFYYGNAPLHGARHLFPVAPMFSLLAARAAFALRSRRTRRFDTSHLRGIAALALLGAVITAARLAWPVYIAVTDSAERQRVDVRAFIRRHDLHEGLVVTFDPFAWTSAFDPYRDGTSIIPVLFDQAGLTELRRAHPDLTPYFVLPGGAIGRPQFPPAPPVVRIEIDQAWPSFQRVDGLAARSVHSAGQVHLPSSGTRALLVYVAERDASLRFTFDVVNTGTYAPHVEGFSGPAFGDYEIRVDDHPLPVWHGFAPTSAALHGEPGRSIELSAGPHEFEARCIGKDDAAQGYLAMWDLLVLEPR